MYRHGPFSARLINACCPYAYMEKQAYVFLTPDEVKHIWQWFGNHHRDRTSCHNFLKDKTYETVKKESFFAEQADEYAHVDEEAVCTEIIQIAKDLKKDINEFIIIPAEEDHWFASTAIDSPAVVPLSSLHAFMHKECMTFVKDYFITSKDFDWWILLCKDEEIHIWHKKWA